MHAVRYDSEIVTFFLWYVILLLVGLIAGVLTRDGKDRSPTEPAGDSNCNTAASTRGGPGGPPLPPGHARWGTLPGPRRFRPNPCPALPAGFHQTLAREYPSI
jgi:hypothetical protein